MRYCDYLHASVLLIGSSAFALILASAGAISRDGSSSLIVVSIVWLVMAVLAGLWVGRGGVQDGVRQLLSRSRPEPVFPHIEPPAVMLSRLWPVLAIVIVAAISTYWFSQLAVAAAGWGLFWALSWRKQSDAVLAIEERDAVHFWIVRNSPFKPPKLVRVPSM